MEPENKLDEIGLESSVRDDKGRFVLGHPNIGAGRPKGSVSIIGKIKKIFEEDPEYFDEYVAEILKDTKLRQEIIRQIDGAPQQNTDITSGGKPIPIYGGQSVSVPGHDSDEEDISA